MKLSPACMNSDQEEQSPGAGVKRIADAELFLKKTSQAQRKAVLLFSDAMQDYFKASLNLPITSDDLFDSSLHEARAMHDRFKDEQLSPNASLFFREH